jgi:hypothetical protein
MDDGGVHSKQYTGRKSSVTWKYISATDKGCDSDTLVLAAISRYLEQEFRFIDAVNIGETRAKGL